MARFIYQVRDAKGGAATGAVNASSVDEASRMLRGDGNIIIDVHEQVAVGGTAGRAKQRKRVRAKRDDVIFFANQLAVMVETGISLPDALDSIAEQTTEERFRRVLTEMSDRVKGGTEFSTALAEYPKVFNNLFVSLVKASEASGTMGKMLQRVAKYLYNEHQARRRVKGAAAYPVGMLGFCVLVVTGMLIFIIPRFAKIYSTRSVALPLPTRMLMGFSSGLISYLPYILVSVFGLGVGLYLFFRRPQGQVLLDKARIEVPLLGKMFRRASLARSLRTLATMVSSGVGLLEGLEITARVAGNAFYRRIWLELAQGLREGSPLSDQMYAFDLIPRSISQMIAAGERTGKLGPVLDRVATFCEEDMDVAIRTVTSFIEPVMIVMMGAIVGGIALAMLLPVFSISKVVSKGGG